jgi:hypothetical protein
MFMLDLPPSSIIPVFRRREVAFILSRQLQPRVALPRDHAAIAFSDVGVGFAGGADSSCVSRHFSRFMEFRHQHPSTPLRSLTAFDTQNVCICDFGVNSLTYLTVVNTANGSMTQWLNCRFSGAPTDTVSFAQLIENLYQYSVCVCTYVRMSVCLSASVTPCVLSTLGNESDHGLLLSCSIVKSVCPCGSRRLCVRACHLR